MSVWPAAAAAVECCCQEQRQEQQPSQHQGCGEDGGVPDTGLGADGGTGNPGARGGLQDQAKAPHLEYPK